jgi:hypothetical protein
MTTPKRRKGIDRFFYILTHRRDGKIDWTTVLVLFGTNLFLFPIVIISVPMSVALAFMVKFSRDPMAFTSPPHTAEGEQSEGKEQRCLPKARKQLPPGFS